MSTKTGSVEELETRLRGLQRSAEEVARMAEGVRPFSYQEWQREAPPATIEELADWDEFLRQRELDREASLAREAGLE